MVQATLVAAIAAAVQFAAAGSARQRPRQGRQGQKGRCAAACVEGCHDGESDERRGCADCPVAKRYENITSGSRSEIGGVDGSDGAKVKYQLKVRDTSHH